MTKKNVPINYSARDFDSIKQQLIQHAKKYYPNSYKDFSEAGFGSFVMDTVAYVGDILSFYLDYQANESFFDTANEYGNIVKHARQIGYRFRENPSSHGIASFFILVPSDSTGDMPDSRYIPVLKAGSVFKTKNGTNFTLTENVNFNKTSNQVITAQVNPDTGAVLSYAIKAYGKIISGKSTVKTYTVGEFTRFLKIPLEIGNVAEILKVEDSEGHEYFEVDYLSQDVIYRPILNRSETNKYAPAVLKPFTVPRRFVVERDENGVYLQFGYGRDSTNDIKEKVADPSSVVLQTFGKDYISDKEFDPTNLINSDTFGLVPENTTLSVTVRINETSDVNAGVDTVTGVVFPSMEFSDPANLDSNLIDSVIASLEVTNEKPILGNVSSMTSLELKQRVKNSFSTQNRAVTQQDYEALIYQMPPIYGAVKRVKVTRDADSFKRNLNIYVLSEDEEQKLIAPNVVIKENIKTWLNKSRMINDTVDILDGKVINFGIEFEIVADFEADRTEVLNNCVNELAKEYTTTREFGEPIFISDIFKILKDVNGVVDVVGAKVVMKNGGSYSDIKFNINENISADGRYINIPDNVVYEIKYPFIDIKGVIR